MSTGNGRNGRRKPAVTPPTTTPARRGPGRPTALTPAVEERIILAVRRGNYIETAAAFAGISKDSLYEWLKRGAREPDSAYAAFSDALEKALAEAEMSDLARIEKAAVEGTWQAAAWRLERRNPKRWALRTGAAAFGMEAPGEGGKPTRFVVWLGGQPLGDEDDVERSR